MTSSRLKAYRVFDRTSGEELGLYHVVPSGKRSTDRGRAYHLAFLDLKERFPEAAFYADVPALSVRRAPEEDEP